MRGFWQRFNYSNNEDDTPLVNAGVLKSDEGETTWGGPPLKNTAFLFYQGMYESQTLVLRYIGQEKLCTTTNEKVYYRGKNIVTIPITQLWLYPEIDEVNRHPSFGISRPFMRFKHWIDGVRSTDLNTNYEPLYPTDETGSVVDYTLINDRCSLGQATDIAAHKRKYDLLAQKNMEHLILYGVSRGAATSFAALAHHQYENVKLCILEAPPGSISAIFKFYLPKSIAQSLYNTSIVRYFLGDQHKTEKEHQAIAYVGKFPAHIPLVIISSLNDGIVIHKTALNLALRVAGHRISVEQTKHIAPVYFLQLDTSGHNEYALKQTPDSMRYQNFIHAVYMRHGLPYIEKFATVGEAELNSAELTHGVLRDQVLYQHQFKFFKSERESTRQLAFNALKTSVTHLSTNEKTRAIKICASMPLYKKELTKRCTLFSKSQIQHDLDLLMDASSKRCSYIG